MASALYNCEFDAVFGAVETSIADRVSVLQRSHHGSARILSAIPMAGVFVAPAAVLRTSLRVSMGQDVVSSGHPHTCGSHGGFAGAIGSRARHIKSCSGLGRGIRAHDAVKNTLAHMVHQCGMTADVANTEEVIGAGGREWKSDILAQNGQESFALDVKIFNLDCATYQRSSNPSVEWITERLRTKERTCRQQTPSVGRGARNREIAISSRL